MRGFLCGWFALFVLSACPAKNTVEEEFFKLVNTRAKGGFEGPDPPMGGGHWQETTLKPIKGGFEIQFIDKSVDLVIKQFARVQWSNVQGARFKKHSYFNRFDAEILLKEEVELHEITQSGATRTDKRTRVGVVFAGFPKEELATQAVHMAQYTAGVKAAMRSNPNVKVTVDEKDVPPPKGDPFRILDGVVYARVCSVSEAIGIKILGNNQKSIEFDKDGVKWQMPLGEERMIVGGVEEPMPVSARMIGSSLYFPLRWVMERVGFQVAWNTATRTVQITTQGDRLNEKR